MSVLEFVLCLLVLNASEAWGIEGELRQDAIWSAAANPYHVTGDLTIPPNRELQIAPGVEVRIAENARISVFGRLRAIGRETAPIRFTIDDEHSLGTWKEIRFIGQEAGQSLLIHAIVERAEVGIACERSSPRVVDSVIRLNAREGILAIESAPRIIHSRILENGSNKRGSGVVVRGSNARPAEILFTVFASNERDGLSVEDNARVLVRHNTFAYNGRSGIAIIQQGQLLEVHQCNFIGNRRYHLQNQTPSEIDAAHNYWGWDETAELRAMAGEGASFIDVGPLSFIYDGQDRPMAGLVHCVPWRDAPVDLEAAYRTWSEQNRLPSPVVPPEASPSSPTVARRGYVIGTSVRPGIVLIDYHKGDGVREGMVFRVRRGNRELGEIVVVDVGRRWSEARIQTPQTHVKRGDRVVLPPLVITTDASWQSSLTPGEGWSKTRLDPGQERYWEPCQVLELREVRADNALKDLLRQGAIPIIWNRAVRRRGKVYFRKRFELDAQPVQATIRWASAGGAELYLNEQWVARFDDPRRAQEVQVAPYLQRGENLVAIACDRGASGKGSYGLGLELTIQRMPGE